MTGEAKATLVIEPGARAALERLLDEVAAAVAERDAALHAAIARGDPAGAARLLAASLRIVVPSRTLREHVASALVRRTGRAVAAVSVHTHWALALEALERAGEAPVRGDALLDVLVRRAAAVEPALAPALGTLQDGYAVVVAAARDLVDAGFTAAHAEAIDDALAAETARGEAVVQRARAVVRATARALDALAREALAPRVAVLGRAAELVDAHGQVLLPTAALWIHGFADATGVVVEWLQALLRAFAARAVVSLPPDPFESGSESEFVATLLDRLSHWAGRAATPLERSPAAPEIRLLRAAGATSEVRAVAGRVRALLDAGAVPESIAIAARDLESYRAALDAQLARLAIPFSSSGASAGPDTRSRRAAALARLLAGGERTPLDVWLDASATPLARDLDLRVGLHVLGVARLDELTVLDLDAALGARSFLVLPVRQGASEDDETPAAGERRRGARPRSRVLPRERLAVAQDAARDLAALLEEWPAAAAGRDHAARLAALLETHLGWDVGDASAALGVFARAVPPAFVLARDELAEGMARGLRAAFTVPLGGAGAGVQVLSIMAARGTSFEHLFVLGSNRDVFPRRPSADPLLPDDLRAALHSVLPDLPVKSRAHAEERHLFADLLASSAHVTLSWQFASDEGRGLARSSFVARLLLAPPELPVEGIVALERDPGAMRRAHEHAVRAALTQPRHRLAPIRAEALREVQRALPHAGPDPDILARCHLAVLDELDPDPTRAPALGPYLGLTGPRPPARAEKIWITQIEASARCGWQAFLRRELGLEPLPDALEALPAMTPLLRGLAVHAVLERIAREAGAATDVSIDEALQGGPVLVPWPSADRLAIWALDEARFLAAQEGIRIDGFARALARWAQRALEVARASDWSDAAGLDVLGAELDGELASPDGAAIGFRVDRADVAGGALRLTDYKTGRPVKDAVRAETRHAAFVKAVSRGERLQAVAYASVRRDPSPIGRFLHLREDVSQDARELVATRDDAELAAAFERSTRAALAAHAQGAQLPRLVDLPNAAEPDACRWCEVAGACLRGESGAARRLLRWTAAAAVAPESLTPLERAAADALLLGRAAPARDGGSA